LEFKGKNTGSIRFGTADCFAFMSWTEIIAESVLILTSNVVSICVCFGGAPEIGFPDLYGHKLVQFKVGCYNIFVNLIGPLISINRFVIIMKSTLRGYSKNI
jgi:hypothetical protein